MNTDSPTSAEQASEAPHPIPTENRRTRLIHVFVGIGTTILLVILMRALRNNENGIHVIGLICFGWLFWAFREHVYQFGDWLESSLHHNRPEKTLKPITTEKTPGEDWYGIVVSISTFVAVGMMITIIVKCGGLTGLRDWWGNHGPQ